MELIKKTTASLVDLALEHDGHLPTSLPSQKRSGTALVQICHGSPGLSLLLAIFKAQYSSLYEAEWDVALERIDSQIWTEGLLTKGLGLCHGVTGNAWSWLLFSNISRV